MFNIKKSKALMLGNIGICLMVITLMCFIYQIPYFYYFNKTDKFIAVISLVLSFGGLILAPLRPKTFARKITAQKCEDSLDEYDISIWYQKNSKIIKTINLNDVTKIQKANDFTFDTKVSMIENNLCLSVEVNSGNFNVLATLCQIDVKDGKELILQKESEIYGIIWHIGIGLQELKKDNIEKFDFRFLVLAEDQEKRVIEKFSKWCTYNIKLKALCLQNKTPTI